MKSFSITSLRQEWIFDVANDAKHLFTSDSHYCHANIIKYSSRPFLNEEEKIKFANKEKFKPCQESVDRMNRELVDKINEVSRPQDILWHLGDVAFGRGNAEKFLSKLNCQKIILIFGNHDSPDLIDIIPKQFARKKGSNVQQFITPCYDQILACIDGQMIHMNHYANDSWEGSHKSWWHLLGHSHGSLNNRHLTNPNLSLSIDVGVDSNNFYPWAMEEIRSLMNKRLLIWQKARSEWKDKEDGGMKPIHEIR